MINAQFVVTKYKDGILAAFQKENRLEEISYEKDDNLIRVQDVYVGKVIDYPRHLQAAFVEVKKGVKCFLPLNHLTPEECSKIHAGDNLLVQVHKEAVRQKDAVLTQNISLPGINVVVSLLNNNISFSSAINRKTKEMIKSEIGNTIIIPDGYGVIFRSRVAEYMRNNALSENTDALIHYFYEINNEIRVLSDHLKQIKELSATRAEFTCLYKSEPEYIKKLSSCIINHPESIEKIVTDDGQLYEEIKLYVNKHTEAASIPVELYKDDSISLFHLLSLNSKINEILSRNVWLNSGSYLVIEQTEALTVIDVNSGKNITGKNKEEYNLKINIEAAREAIRQIRLRHISGIIIIDFINMADNNNKHTLINELKNLTLNESIKTRFVDITALGLVEITREKKERLLSELFLDKQ